MSKKSKNKKPKPKQIEILSATEMSDYIRLKFEMECDKFWEELFSECPWGDTALLCLHEDQVPLYSKNMLKYFNIIKEEFINDANEEFCVEIENDV